MPRTRPSGDRPCSLLSPLNAGKCPNIPKGDRAHLFIVANATWQMGIAKKRGLKPLTRNKRYRIPPRLVKYLAGDLLR